MALHSPILGPERPQGQEPETKRLRNRLSDSEVFLPFEGPLIYIMQDDAEELEEEENKDAEQNLVVQEVHELKNSLQGICTQVLP